VFAGCLTEEGVRRLKDDEMFEGVALMKTSGIHHHHHQKNRKASINNCCDFIP